MFSCFLICQVILDCILNIVKDGWDSILLCSSEGRGFFFLWIVSFLFLSGSEPVWTPAPSLIFLGMGGRWNLSFFLSALAGLIGVFPSHAWCVGWQGACTEFSPTELETSCFWLFPFLPGLFRSWAVVISLDSHFSSQFLPLGETRGEALGTASCWAWDLAPRPRTLLTVLCYLHYGG